MEKENIIRAWKDEDYRLSLSIEEQRSLPANPAGMVELSQKDLTDAAERGATIVIITYFCL
jgi:mersacidin/lichenicidin family type 2 lantibiotic